MKVKLRPCDSLQLNKLSNPCTEVMVNYTILRHMKLQPNSPEQFWCWSSLKRIAFVLQLGSLYLLNFILCTAYWWDFRKNGWKSWFRPQKGTARLSSFGKFNACLGCYGNFMTVWSKHNSITTRMWFIIKRTAAISGSFFCNSEWTARNICPSSSRFSFWESMMTWPIYIMVFQTLLHWLAWFSEVLVLNRGCVVLLSML